MCISYFITAPWSTILCGALLMRKLIARIFDYSLDGLVPKEDTEFCRDLPDGPA